jgi:1-acyl-sn-glycerol-3-phosphate acyltransferase
MHHFPEPPYIVCPNHSSYLDIVLMFQAVPHNFIFMGKQEIESWPMFNILFTKGRHILVDRKNPIKAQKAYLQAAKEVDNGESLIIFPEGTIWPFVPKLKPFKNGAFRMAIEKQIPIVPITFTKNYQRLKTGAFLKAPGSPGFAEVIIHPPVETKSLSEKDVLALRDKVFEIIQSPFTKHGN